MKKQVLFIALSILLTAVLLSNLSQPATASTFAAEPTASAVLVNGEQVAFDAYNIEGNNYFKLRDLACVLSGTEKQFEVGWDGANNAISLIEGQAYTPVGGEMAGKDVGGNAAQATGAKVFLNGKELALTAYNIGGNNYFKLRDIGQALDFGVGWNGAENIIVLDTSMGYTPEASSAAASAQPSTSTDGPVTFFDLREVEYDLGEYEWSYGIRATARIGPRSGHPASFDFGFTYWGEDGKKKNAFVSTGEGWMDDPPYYEIGFHTGLHQVIKGLMPPGGGLVDGETYHWVAYVVVDGQKYESAPRSFTFKLPAVLPETQTKPEDPTVRFENMGTIWRKDNGFVGRHIGYVFHLEYEFYGGWNYSQIGIQCWDSAGKEISYEITPANQKWTGTDSRGVGDPFFCSLYQTNTSFENGRGSLIPGQTYTWQAHVISDGVRYESEIQTFVFTLGTPEQSP